MTDQAATQAENMGNEAQGPAAEGKGERLFTQEEVNGFIQARVSQMKRQAAKEAQSEYAQKLQEIQAREMKLLVKEKLSDRGMPRELADIITCVDDKDLENKLDALQRIYGGGETAADDETPASSGFRAIGAAPGEKVRHDDPVRKAMGLGEKG